MVYIYIGIGGALGSLLRYFVSVLFNQTNALFPYATLLVNILGSFLLAYSTAYLFKKWKPSKEIQLALTVGVLGSFTTFSTFSMEMVNLLENQHYGLAFIYSLLSLFGGIGMAIVGMVCQKKGRNDS